MEGIFKAWNEKHGIGVGVVRYKILVYGLEGWLAWRTRIVLIKK